MNMIRYDQTAIKPAFGDNEITVRLGLLADDAHHALEQVAKGEGDAISGWMAYGAALNEGRALFAGDLEFGQWLRSSNLEEGIHPAEQSAAMWAAANPEQFEQARAAGNARTVRGIHAKWNEIDAERAAIEARAIAEKARQEAKERAAAEAEARRAEQEAKNEEARALAAAAKEAAEKASAKAVQDAKKAENTAKKAEKKADKVKAGNNSADHVRGTLGTGENEWYTPQDHIDRARDVMGSIDLDPASSEVANETVRAAVFFSEADNGLNRYWQGNVWLNPPYAQPAIAHFADKIVAEWESGRLTAAIALTHNYTDTAWFQKMARAATAICFTRGRVRFFSPSGEIAAPTQGQAFFYFGSDVDAFSEAFSGVGFVVEVR
jgi:phage N-6-adenine-methyltransferase